MVREKGREKREKETHTTRFAFPVSLFPLHLLASIIFTNRSNR